MRLRAAAGLAVALVVATQVAARAQEGGWCTGPQGGGSLARAADRWADSAALRAERSQYATSAEWFTRNEPVRFEGAWYVSTGLPRVFGPWQLKKAGIYIGVPVLAASEAVRPYPSIWVPVNPCEFQEYQLHPGRARPTTPPRQAADGTAPATTTACVLHCSRMESVDVVYRGRGRSSTFPSARSASSRRTRTRGDRDGDVARHPLGGATRALNPRRVALSFTSNRGVGR